MYPLSANITNEVFSIGLLEEQNFLNIDEIDTLHDVVRDTNLKRGLTSNKDFFDTKNQQNINFSMEYEDNKSIRTNFMTWINYDKNNIELSLIFKKIHNKIIDVNNKVFKYILTDVEPLQYTSYDQNEYYGKHLDLSSQLLAGNLQRKLSFTIQLSDPDDYVGGNLKVYSGPEPILADKKKGTIIFFPSFLLHEVEKVTYGKRLSLVSWVWGPKFV